MSLLVADTIGKSFGGLRALANVSFAIEEGEIVGLMGANGAGKTTLFSIIAGHQRPTEGDIQFKGGSITGLRPDRICHLGIARTFQAGRLFAGLDVLDNLAVTGVGGMPPLESAGNVLRPRTAVKLSLRVPPTTDVDAATARLLGCPFATQFVCRSDGFGCG